MAAIDRLQMMEDLLFWLPPSNTLEKSVLTKLVSLVIGRVGDDDTNNGQVLCESLEAAAIKNLSEASSGGSQIKKETLGGHAKEYFEGGTEAYWRDFISTLDDVCPLFGYERSSYTGISISPGDPMTICGEEIDSLF